MFYIHLLFQQACLVVAWRYVRILIDSRQPEFTYGRPTVMTKLSLQIRGNYKLNIIILFFAFSIKSITYLVYYLAFLFIQYRDSI